jgi:hypothetical protein
MRDVAPARALPVHNPAMRVIARQQQPKSTAAELRRVVEGVGRGRVLHPLGKKALAVVVDSAFASVQRALPGWSLTPQAASIPVPDARRKVRRAA